MNWHLNKSWTSIFTARCYASAVLAMGLCLSFCVCQCLCLSQVGVLLKRLNVGSHKQHRTKFDWGHPLRGRQMQVGWVKIGDFRQISGYISKTVQDRRMVSIKVEYEVVCALSNGDIADDLEWPLSAPNYPNLYILHRFSFFVMSVGRNFKIWYTDLP